MQVLGYDVMALLLTESVDALIERASIRTTGAVCISHAEFVKRIGRCLASEVGQGLESARIPHREIPDFIWEEDYLTTLRVAINEVSAVHARISLTFLDVVRQFLSMYISETCRTNMDLAGRNRPKCKPQPCVDMCLFVQNLPACLLCEGACDFNFSM